MGTGAHFRHLNHRCRPVGKLGSQPFRRGLQARGPDGTFRACWRLLVLKWVKTNSLDWTVNGVGRKHVFTRSELLDHTKQLLLEHGYEGFHLKSLSKRLTGARSTIYQYYANKEEIVAACMRRAMEEILQQASTVNEEDCMNALRQLLTIYLKEHGFHRLLGFAHKIDTSKSAAAAKDLAFVEEGHRTLQRQLERLFARALQEGRLKQDIPLPVMIGVFFNLINTPNFANLPLPQWSEMLYRLFLEGAGK